MQNKPRIRQYIRHPADVPIQVSLNWVPDELQTLDCENTNNVSLGGLAFVAPRALPIGQAVSISFPLLDESRHLSGKVVWNRENTAGFEIGVQFEDANELYCLRMIEQVCHIEHYRKQVALLEGRQLSSEQAAKEWISRYAKNFPALLP